jgi:apolipoprotein N-acyltransferase
MESLAGRFVLLWGWRRGLAAFAAGALAVLAQAPYDFFAACFVSFPVLVWLLDGAAGDARAGFAGRLRPAFAVGWWFGFGYFVAGLWWIGNALLVEAESFAWALPLAVVALPALLALFYGLACALARLMWTDDLGRVFALAFGFGAAEWLRGILFTGFPWNAVGHAAMPIPLLMQSSAVVGIAGMNALAVFVFSAPALLATPGRARWGLWLATLLVVVHAGFGAWRLSSADATGARTLAVRIVQPSIDQSEKWDATTRDRIFATHLDLTRRPVAEGAPQPQLVLWPETSVPYILTENPQALAAMASAIGTSGLLLAGAVRAEEGAAGGGGPRYYNSITAVDGAGEIVDSADKVHLVPFGEYLPFEPLLRRIGLTQIVETPVSFTPGASRRLLELPGGVAALPLVCYEVIFPHLVERDVARSDVIVNVTNDAWFGDSPGPIQHFRQAQLRAVEAGLPLVRAANNGISGAVDAYGRVIDALALDSRASIDVAVPLQKLRPFAWGSPAVNGVAAFLVMGLLGAAIRLRARRRIN